jgi:hypothetical protein
MVGVSTSDAVPTHVDKAMELFLECEVGEFGSKQTVEVGDAVKGKRGNCPSGGKVDYSFGWCGGVVVDDKVSCGFHVYIRVDRGVVDGDCIGASWWRALLRKDGWCCGGEIFFDRS